MSTKHYCDICGAEYGAPETIEVTIQRHGIVKGVLNQTEMLIRREYEVCANCNINLQKSIKAMDISKDLKELVNKVQDILKINFIEGDKT